MDEAANLACVHSYVWKMPQLLTAKPRFIREEEFCQ